MLKKILFTLLIAVSFISFSQTNEGKAKWSTTVEYLDNGNIRINVISNIEEGWHIYSLYTPEGGAMPTSISFLNILVRVLFDLAANESVYLSCCEYQ